MSLEKPTSPSVELTRKQKIARRFLPIALLAGGATAFGIAETSSDEKPEKEQAYSITVQTYAEMELGGSDEGWGHGAAENLIRRNLANGVAKALSRQAEYESDPDDHVVEIVESVPVYEQADLALKKAHYQDVAPDEGDKLSIQMNVTLDPDNKVSYEIVEAEIEDISNNQK